MLVQVYVPDANVSWVEASITKGHVVNNDTVEVVLEADASEENGDKHPEAGSVRTVPVRFPPSFVIVFEVVHLLACCCSFTDLFVCLLTCLLLAIE